jgi:PAT family acetyl-CoA transporter-like MFS transporter 1
VLLDQFGSQLMFVSQMAFFARVSDPAIGGTYMTLLNTVANLGSKWPASLSLALMEPLTSATCAINVSHHVHRSAKRADGAKRWLLDGESCAGRDARDACVAAGGDCEVAVDGYVVQMAICALFGLVWLAYATKHIRALQAKKPATWHVPTSATHAREV